MSETAGGPGPRTDDVGPPRGAVDRFRWWRRAVLPTVGARVSAALLVVALVVNLGARGVPGPVVLAPAGNVVVVDTFVVVLVTQWFLMPLLALTLLAATSSPRSRLVRLTLLSVVLAALGDVLPGLVGPRWSSLVVVLASVGAQVTYVVAFWPYRRAALTGRRRALPVVYGAVYVAVVGTVTVVALGSGVLVGTGFVVAVAVHGVLLVTTAVLAAGVHRACAVGAGLVVVSGGLLALGAAGVPWVLALPVGWHGVLVVAASVVGQGLIALGVLRRDG
ncbi:hypothetical protein GCM10009809_39370 [Isoptericola hypogeus]|uniref:YhhN-like protein n=1 Tax=Isoptericola hypogeus TaxID=300179 RepID=A0ABP4VZ13_9MICO